MNANAALFSSFKKMNNEEYFKTILKGSRILGDTTFVKETIINTRESEQCKEWKELVDFSGDKYAVSKNGGAIAIAHQKCFDEEGYCEKIHIYDTYCNLISIINLVQKTRLYGLFFSPEECIVVLYINGITQTYHLRGYKISECLTYNGSEIFVNFASFTGHDLFIATSNSIVYRFSELANLVPYQFTTYSGDSLLMGHVSPANPITGYDASIWCCDINGRLVLLQEHDYETCDFPINIQNIAFSPDYSMVLVQNEGNYLFCESDFSNIILNIEFNDLEASRIAWCGSDAIILHSDSMLVMIGAESEAIKWGFDDSVGICSEIDGIRVFSKNGVYLIRAIPETVRTFSLWNSNTPSVSLFLALINDRDLAFNDPSQTVDLDQLRESLNILYDVCLFFRQYEQRKALLTAITRLMFLIERNEPDSGAILSSIRDFSLFSDTLSTIRVCLVISHSPYNMMMTHLQFLNITSSVLLKRLCNRSLHFESFRIANYLSVDTELIASHWAHCIINTSLPIKDIVKRIQLMKEPIDYVDLATTSFSDGKTELALALLEANPAKARGVPLLIKRGQWKEALESAIQSSDNSLILYSILKAKEANQNTIINNVLKDNPVARAIWRINLSEQEQKSFDIETGFSDYYRVIDSINGVSNEELQLSIDLKKKNDPFMYEVFNIYTLIRPIKTWLSTEKGVPDANILTIDQILELVILNDDLTKAKEIAKMIDMPNEDLYWKRLFVSIKNENYQPLVSLRKDLKQKGIKPFIDYCEINNHKQAFMVLNGMDPAP